MKPKKRVQVQTAWTWEEIEGLKDPSRIKEYERFLATFGRRAKVALMAAGHAPGTWGPCNMNWPCAECSLKTDAGWRVNRLSYCSEDAYAVYKRMVKELGVLPKEKKGPSPK